MIENTLAYMKKVVTGEFVMPCDVELHPTNYCNQDCIWCIMSEHRKKQGQLSHSQLKSIAQQMYENKDMKYIFISGGGEPLLNDNLFLPFVNEGKTYSNYFEMLYSFGISIGMSSNGEFLHKLIESESYKCIDALRISIDAGTEFQYSKLHRSKKGFLLKDLIKVIEEYYQVSGKSVQVSYLVHELNKNSYVELANMFTVSEAVSKIDVKSLMGSDNTFGNDYKDTNINDIEIKFAREKVTPKYNFSGITNILINACGKVYPCCHMVDDNDAHLLGHIDEISLIEMIHNQYAKLKACECERCSYLENNQLLSKFKEIGGERYDKL